MTAGKMQGANVFAIQVHGDIMIKSDNRQRLFRSGFPLHGNRAEISGHAALLKPLTHIVVRDDRRLLLEKRIPASVISVVVGVDDEPDRLVGNPF